MLLNNYHSMERHNLFGSKSPHFGGAYLSLARIRCLRKLSNLMAGEVIEELVEG